MPSSRYIRPPDGSRVVLQERDRQLIGAVHRFGSLTAEHLRALFFVSCSLRTAQARLRRLWAAGYLERAFLPRLIGTERPLHGGRPLYRVSSRGRGALRAAGGKSITRRPGSAATIEHDLIATELLVAVECAVRRLPDLNVTTWTEGELWSAVGQLGARRQARLVSDGAFTLAGKPSGKALSFHLEVVRASVRGGNQAILRRMRRYARLARDGYFKRAFGQDMLRAVLITTPTEQRAQNLRHLAASLSHARRLFWFTNYERREPGRGPSCRFTPESIFELEWLDGNGEVQRLGDSFT